MMGRQTGDQSHLSTCPSVSRFRSVMHECRRVDYDLNVSAQIRATAGSGEIAPGIVAHPPFSRNRSRSQSNLNLFNALRFSVAFDA
jgi:hypothetical protein